MAMGKQEQKELNKIAKRKAKKRMNTKQTKTEQVRL